MLHLKLKRHQKLQRQRDASPLSSNFSGASSSVIKHAAGTSTSRLFDKDFSRENFVHRKLFEPSEGNESVCGADQRRVLYKALKDSHVTKTRSFESVRVPNSAMSHTPELALSEDPQILLLGPPRTGKTTLVKRLSFLLNSQRVRSSSSGENEKETPLLPATTATIGAESSTLEVCPNRSKSPLHHQGLSLQSRRSSSPLLKKNSFPNTLRLQVKELGGKNGTLWYHFLDQSVSVIVYVIDIGNPCQISLAVSQLVALLDSPPLQNASFAIVLNKRDSPCAMSGVRFENISGLSKIISRYPNQCITIETSCRTMENVGKLLSWLVAQAVASEF